MLKQENVDVEKGGEVQKGCQPEPSQSPAPPQVPRQSGTKVCIFSVKARTMELKFIASFASLGID